MNRWTEKDLDYATAPEFKFSARFCMESLQKYENTNLTPSEIIELKEKHTVTLSKLIPGEPKSIYENEAICPYCSEVIDESDSYLVCCFCGKVIDWRNW